MVTIATANPSRRGFLGIAAAAAGAPLLAGCEDRKPSEAGFVPAPVKPGTAPAVDAVTALNTTLAAEHQAIATYTLLTPLLTATASTLGRFKKDHEAHRDALIARVRAAGGTPVAALPSPTLSPAPANEAAALAAAADLEDAVAKTCFRMVAGSADAAVRTVLVSIMGAEAQHSAVLRAAGGQAPVPAPFQTT